MATIKARLEKLEAKQHSPARLVVVPSWGDFVTIDGEQVPISEYKRNPKAMVINLTWGDDDKTSDQGANHEPR